MGSDMHMPLSRAQWTYCHIDAVQRGVMNGTLTSYEKGASGIH
jgi:hypothetical protein